MRARVPLDISPMPRCCRSSARNSCWRTATAVPFMSACIIVAQLVMTPMAPLDHP